MEKKEYMKLYYRRNRKKIIDKNSAYNRIHRNKKKNEKDDGYRGDSGYYEDDFIYDAF